MHRILGTSKSTSAIGYLAAIIAIIVAISDYVQAEGVGELTWPLLIVAIYTAISGRLQRDNSVSSEKAGIK